MYTEKRYRGRKPDQVWVDLGPDLLRTPSNLSQWLKMRGIARYTSKKEDDGSWTPWKRLIGPASLRFRIRTLDNQQTMRVANKNKDVFGVVKAEHVVVREIDRATGDAELVHALIEYQFGAGIDFGGIYNCRRIDGSSSWSVHAWGDAVDETPNGRGITNDGLTDWNCRMAREGDDMMPVVRILGSRNGHEVECLGPGFYPSTFSGSGSHLWHNHLECNFHYGTPPCAQ